ncbi:MAG: SLBB domain-containing protein, partial [Deltaproteobacteria bacterium]|nr:SLBB domain-containing protein [Deltaproteobacteria bacterium]
RNNAELARTQVGPDSKTYHTYMSVDLAPVLSGDTTRDIILNNNDQIFIKVATNWHLPESVQLVGQVARPGPYVIRPGEQLSSVLLRCGGFLPDAFPQGIVLLRQSVQKLEQNRIDEAKERLSQQMAQYSMTLTTVSATNSTNGSSGFGAATAGLATLQQLLAAASSEQAEGRVVVHFNSLEQLAGSPEDVLLEDQDTITIPKRPSSVLVLGQVNNPTAIAARPGLTVSDYLYKAGGPTTNGDMNQLMLIKADGSVITEDSIKNGRGSLFPLLALTSGGILNRTVNAGDTIYVPDNLTDIPKMISLTEKKDIAQIVASAAQGVAVVGILASNL